MLLNGKDQDDSPKGDEDYNAPPASDAQAFFGRMLRFLLTFVRILVSCNTDGVIDFVGPVYDSMSVSAVLAVLVAAMALLHGAQSGART